jgi:glycosyltransferase involved in cell wall biosynthesis
VTLRGAQNNMEAFPRESEARRSPAESGEFRSGVESGIMPLDASGEPTPSRAISVKVEAGAILKKRRGAPSIRPETPPAADQAAGTVSAVCITGMHRSGTSMVARILGACGLDLGPAEELMGPRPDNPDGFFENVRFVLLSDGVLAAFGGLFDNPPELPEDWVQQARLDGLRLMARELATSWSGRGPWGWKDPRCCMTLPFWQALIPDLRVVVCLRDPRAVLQSLERRGYGSPLPMERLWVRYHDALLAAVGTASRVVTHYDAYFNDPQAEIRRVLTTLGMTATPTAIANAAKLVSGTMRHHGGSGGEQTGKPLPPEIVAIYRDLLGEAGDAIRPARHTTSSATEGLDGDETRRVREAQQTTGRLREELSEAHRDLAAVRDSLAKSDAALAEMKAGQARLVMEVQTLQSNLEAGCEESARLQSRLKRGELDRQVLKDAFRTARRELAEALAVSRRDAKERIALEVGLDRLRADHGRLLRTLKRSERKLENQSLLRVKVGELEAIRVAQGARLERLGARYSELLALADSMERELASARARRTGPQAAADGPVSPPAVDGTRETAAEAVAPASQNAASGTLSPGESSGNGGPAVLFISHDANPHGAQIFLLQFLEWMKKNSDIPVEILLGHGGPLAGRFTAVGRTSVWPAGISGGTPLPDGDPLMKRFREAGVGLVYSNTIVNGRILAGLSRLGRIVISHPHELDYWMKNRLPKGDLRLALDQSDHFVACSRAVCRSLVESLGVPADRVSVVYEFIPLEPRETSTVDAARSRVREELGAGSDAEIVCGSGTTDWRKAPDLFVQVARLVRGRLSGRDVHFIWVGGDAEGAEFTQLRHDVEKSGLAGAVHFLGHRPDPRDCFAASDVFILPSREDPFPLVNLEAASEGVPIVCFDGSGGSGEFVEEDAGFVVPYLDVEAMAGRVVEILTTPGLRDRLGRRAAEKVRERHDIEVVAPKLLDLIESRLRKAAGSRA